MYTAPPGTRQCTRLKASNNGVRLTVKDITLLIFKPTANSHHTTPLPLPYQTTKTKTKTKWETGCITLPDKNPQKKKQRDDHKVKGEATVQGNRRCREEQSYDQE